VEESTSGYPQCELVEKRKTNSGNWRFTLEHIGRQLRKLYPPADTPPGLPALFTRERRRETAMRRRHAMHEDGGRRVGFAVRIPNPTFYNSFRPGRWQAAERHRHCSIAFVSAQGGDSAISLCRYIGLYPTFVLQTATTRNAVFPYAQRGPDTKQTSDAIQAKISIRAFFFIRTTSASSR
jgi:hypothetical protein